MTAKEAAIKAIELEDLKEAAKWAGIASDIAAISESRIDMRWAAAAWAAVLIDYSLFISKPKPARVM